MTASNEHKEKPAGKSSRRIRAVAVITMAVALLLPAVPGYLSVDNVINHFIHLNFLVDDADCAEMIK